MVFSKSFGYAIRSIVYLAMVSEKKQKVQLGEIAETLDIPRYFLAKVMNRLVKEGIIAAVKGHNGGFSSNEKTLSTRLTRIMELTGDSLQTNQCVLHLGRCNAAQPCAVHHKMEPMKRQWDALLKTITVQDLIKKDQINFL